MSLRCMFIWWAREWLAVWWPIQLHMHTRCWTLRLRTVIFALRNRIRPNVQSADFGWTRITEGRKLPQDLSLVWGNEMFLWYVLYVLVTYHLITVCYCHFTAFQLEILMWESKPPQVLVVIVVVAAQAEK
jgi:hypothetical protein